VQAGDHLQRLLRPSHPVTIGMVAQDSATPEQMRTMLDSEVSLAPSVKAMATRVAARA